MWAKIFGQKNILDTWSDVVLVFYDGRSGFSSLEKKIII